jgi:glycosyltransferase involved in cell wall biosynthesis
MITRDLVGGVNLQERFYFFLEHLADGATNMEQLVLLRSQLFERRLHLSPIIVSLNYEPHFARKRKQLIDRGVLDTKTTLLNMYADLQQTSQEMEIPKEWPFNPLWSYEKVPDSTDLGVLDQDGKPVQYRNYSDDGRLEMVVHYDRQGRIIRSDIYDANGFLSKVQVIQGDHVTCEIFYRTDGKVCMYHFFEQDELAIIQLVDDDGSIIYQCDTVAELAAFWLKMMLEEHETNYCFIDEQDPFAMILDEVGMKAKRITMVHSPHVDFPNSPIDGSLNDTYLHVFQQLDKSAAVVFDSMEQHDHVQERFGTLKNQFFIHPALVDLPERVDFSTRKPYAMLFTAPFEPQFNPQAAVRIFAQVVQALPDATMYMCGEGSERAAVEQLIDELGLNDKVGIIPQLDENVYNHVQMAISTSIESDTPLSILYNLSYGVPTASYNYFYGPGDMILHKISGLLASRNDEQELAALLIERLSNQQSTREMSDHAYGEAVRFHADNTRILWIQLIQRLRENTWKQF